jgi:hypothetical protein
MRTSICLSLDSEDLTLADEAAAENRISRSRLLVRCAVYCIRNGLLSAALQGSKTEKTFKSVVTASAK